MVCRRQDEWFKPSFQPGVGEIKSHHIRVLDRRMHLTNSKMVEDNRNRVLCGGSMIGMQGFSGCRRPHWVALTSCGSMIGVKVER